METRLKVGQLARRTGLTVRTLHHYDEIGLLPAGERSAAGHRLYGTEELRRLQQIASLRDLGLSLDEIRGCLERPEYTLDHVLALHLDRLREQIEQQQALCDRIERLRDRLATAEGVSVDELTRTIEVTMNYEKYYTPDQMEHLAGRREEVGEERIREVQQEWTELFDAFEDAMERDLDPASDEVQALARRSAALITEFTGGDPGIMKSLGTMYREEGAAKVAGSHGMPSSPGLWAYMGRARAALQGGDADGRPTT